MMLRSRVTRQTLHRTSGSGSGSGATLVWSGLVQTAPTTSTLEVDYTSGVDVGVGVDVEQKERVWIMLYMKIGGV